MVRPERPSRLYSTYPDARPGAFRPRRRSELGADLHLGLREAPAADHRRAADAVPGQAAQPDLGLRELLQDGAPDLAGQHERVDHDDREEADPQDDRVAADGDARRELGDQHEDDDEQEDARDVPPGVDDLAGQP